MIERKIKKDKTYIVGYHTQEFRCMEQPLGEPCICNHHTAWLGVGFYFWVDEEFAHFWGEDFKMNTGAYDIYVAEIESNNIINAVFDEEGYFFFRNSIHKAIKKLEATKKNVTLEAVHRFLVNNVWAKMGVNGIMYDDIPKNPRHKPRTYSKIPELYYKKRIQIVVFDLKYISNFELYKEEQS